MPHSVPRGRVGGTAFAFLFVVELTGCSGRRRNHRDSVRVTLRLRDEGRDSFHPKSCPADSQDM